MFATQSTTRVSAVIAAAGACLLLGACGGGSNGTSASGSSSGSSSSGPAPAITGSPSKGLLTGNFCKDFGRLSTAIAPSKAQIKEINTNKSAAGNFMDQIAADFDGLGKEGPPKIQTAMHTIANQYSSLSAAARSGKSIQQLEGDAGKLTTAGATRAAFKVVTTYRGTTCGSSSS
jgi:hypothetical protein